MHPLATHGLPVPPGTSRSLFPQQILDSQRHHPDSPPTHGQDARSCPPALQALLLETDATHARIPVAGYRNGTRLHAQLLFQHQRHSDATRIRTHVPGAPGTAVPGLALDALDLAVAPNMPRYVAPPGQQPFALPAAARTARPHRAIQAELDEEDAFRASPRPPAGVRPATYGKLIEEMRRIRHRAAHAPTEGLNAAYIRPLAAMPGSTQLVLAFDDMPEGPADEFAGVISIGPQGERRTGQSVLKTLSYALAVDQDPAAADLAGCLPTSTPFNQPATVGNHRRPADVSAADAAKQREDYVELSRLLVQQGDARPANAMNNIGALLYSLMRSGVVPLRGRGARVDAGAEGRTFNLVRLLQQLAAVPGRPAPRIGIDMDVMLGEYIDSPGNRAYADLAVRQLHPGLDAARRAELADMAYAAYIDQCSLSLDATVLTRAMRTLFNGGVNPATGERVLSQFAADAAVRQMAACGLYQDTQAVHERQGYIGKSGVSGMLFARSDGYPVTIGVCSEPLDAAGNSAKGQAMIAALLRSDAFRDVMHEISLHRLGHQPAPGLAQQPVPMQVMVA